MTRESVASSSLASVGYSASERLLEVQFHSGIIYRYLDVPSDAHAALLEAGSLGAHFNQHIRSRYRFTRCE